ISPTMATTTRRKRLKTRVRSGGLLGRSRGARRPGGAPDFLARPPRPREPTLALDRRHLRVGPGRYGGRRPVLLAELRGVRDGAYHEQTHPRKLRAFDGDRGFVRARERHD